MPESTPDTPPGPDARLAAVCDLMLSDVREAAGLHRYDGQIQDLSEDGVGAGLNRLGGDPLADPHDEAHLRLFEDGLRWYFGEFQAHRRDPLPHLFGLDLSCYDREYAPAAERDAARAAQLAGWPDAVDVAVRTLDQVPAPVARALLSATRGLAQALDTDPAPASDAVLAAARTAHHRLVAHLERIAETGDPEACVGAAALAGSMNAFEGLDVDLGALADQAESETRRLTELLDDACGRLRPGVPTGEVVIELLADHPDPDGVLPQARALTAEVLAFTAEHQLVPWTDGECLVGPAPASRRWAMAMMAWAGPEEPDAPSWYWVTPPEPDWEPEAIEEWMAVFSRTALPAITAHEVSPGHFAHARCLRRAPSAVRRQLFSGTFAEGWAHYVEEVMLEVGFRADDPRYAAGVALEALIRVTRLVAAIGLHTGAMTVDDATARFAADAYLRGSAARAEADRGTFDIGYGRYTLGKLRLLELREQARTQWGDQFGLPRFHAALMDLGAPPIGLVGTALERG